MGNRGCECTHSNGGLPAWRSAGGSIETGQVSPQLGNVTVLHDDLYAGQR